MTGRELKALTISAVLLALAFGIAFAGGFPALFEPWDLAVAISLALVAVSTSFLLHELAHRFVARRFGCYAEYRVWPAGLALALAFSFFGFVFAAPGAVMISPGRDTWGRTTLTRQRYGLISMAGPAVNICLAAVFLILDGLYPSALFSIGAFVNTWLAAFNLIPFGPLDGAKIFKWDRSVWLIAVMVAVVLLAIQVLIL